MTATYKDIGVSIAGHVGQIEIQRPPHNYFDNALINQIADALEAFDRDPECRAVVLCAQGKSFCAGADFANRPTTGAGNESGKHLYKEATRIFRSKKPIVAAVQGAAIGGGLGLALAADFRVTCSEGRFSANFNRLGFHPGFSLTYTLPRLVGQQKANLLFYTGRRVTGDEAVAMGMADVLVPLADVRTAATALATEIAQSVAARRAVDARDDAARLRGRRRAGDRARADRAGVDAQDGRLQGGRQGLGREAAAELPGALTSGICMRIERIDLYWARVPLAFVWKTSYGDQHVTDTILVRMEGGGHHAWGESCPPAIPGYSAEHTLGTFHTLREHLAPASSARTWSRPRTSWIASRSSRATSSRGPASRSPGGCSTPSGAACRCTSPSAATGDRVAVGADFGVQDSIDVLLAKIQGAVDQGFPRIKLKFRPGWDLPMVDAVRSAFPRFTFHVDCNAAYTPEDTDLFRKLDRYRAGHDRAAARRRRDEPDQPRGSAAGDRDPDLPRRERASLAHVQAAIRLGSCKVVNVKVARVGGLSASRDIQSLCAEHDIPCWIGGMLESAVGGAICAELATLPNFTYAGDIFPSSYFYDDDLGKPEIELSGPGEVTTSAVPGIAQEPDPELLQRWTVAHAGFRV